MCRTSMISNHFTIQSDASTVVFGYGKRRCGRPKPAPFGQGKNWELLALFSCDNRDLARVSLPPKLALLSASIANPLRCLCLSVPPMNVPRCFLDSSRISIGLLCQSAAIPLLPSSLNGGGLSRRTAFPGTPKLQLATENFRCLVRMRICRLGCVRPRWILSGWKKVDLLPLRLCDIYREHPI